MARNRICWYVTIICGLQLAAPLVLGQGQLRKARVGDRMEAFSLADVKGTSFSYQPDAGRVLAVAFLSAHQARSDRAIAELEQIVSDLRRDGHPLDLVVVTSGVDDVKYSEPPRKGSGLHVPILVDRDDQLWGKLGITATPTVIVADRKGMIGWIRAGHGYDFAEEARSAVGQAMGIEQKNKVEPHGQVETLRNDTSEDRAIRHLKMGRLLDDEGHTEAAIAELRKAETLMPKSAEVQLELGRLLCHAGRGQEAVSLVGKIPATAPAEEAEVKMLAGWAHRLLGDRDVAEKLLNESIRLNPQSVRALYELGKAYRERGENEKAMEAYDRALAVHFQEAPFSSVPKHGEPAQRDSGK